MAKALPWPDDLPADGLGTGPSRPDYARGPQLELELKVSCALPAALFLFHGVFARPALVDIVDRPGIEPGSAKQLGLPHSRA